MEHTISKKPSGAARSRRPVLTEVVACDDRRVLLVDDEEGIRALFQMILASALADYSIEVAGNGAEALDMFSRGHHAVLLMDLHMPVMDGLTAFNEIEKFCRTLSWEMPSVVFCTGFAPPDSVTREVESNSKHGLILKPVTTDVLLHAIKSRLG